MIFEALFILIKPNSNSFFIPSALKVNEVYAESKKPKNMHLAKFCVTVNHKSATRPARQK